jgi:hypothetical protein
MRRVDRQGERPLRGATCLACKGTGRVEKPRLFMSFETGEGSTLSEWARCPYCWDNPGRRNRLRPLA